MNNKLTIFKLGRIPPATSALVQNFSATADDEAETLSAIVTIHTKSKEEAVAKV